MFSIETKVKGDIVNMIRVKNDMLEVEGKYRYSVECHRFEEPRVVNFYVFHDIVDGIEDLSFRIFKRLREEIKKYHKMEEERLK